MLEEDSLEIYVDSSTSAAEKKGTVGVRILVIDSRGDEVPYDFQATGYLNVHSGQMEIVACSYAIDVMCDRNLVFGKKRATIFTDSKYVSDNYKNAMFHWVGNRWSWKDGRPVLDATEWKRLVRQLQNCLKSGVYIDIKWVKGHDKNQHNIAVHKLAKDAMRLPVEMLSKNKVISIFRPQPIQSPKRLDIGSVKMEGQRVSIKILGVEYLPVQKLWSCKYQVVSNTSSYYGCVDKVFSSVSLDVGRSYFVKLNNDIKNPRVERVYREIHGAS